MYRPTEIGRKAERLTADYLEARGYEIVERNWRTKSCEIDIIAYKSDMLYFVEVKFRSGAGYGTGFEYITWTKLRQMSYAARLWNVKNFWKGAYCLSAASVNPAGEVSFIKQLQSD